MMKFWKKVLMAVGLVFSVFVLAACANNNSGSNDSSSKTSSSQSTKQSATSRVNRSSKNSNALIVYFTLTGTTEGAAKYIQKQTGANIIRLRPQKPYGDYDSTVRRGDRERRNNIHPALATNIPNFSKYKTVLIGYPTWWSRPPMIIHTLFDKYDFRGKTVIPFTTSMSTPIGPSEAVIKQLAQQDGASFKNGIRYDENNGAVRSWLNNLGLLNR